MAENTQDVAQQEVVGTGVTETPEQNNQIDQLAVESLTKEIEDFKKTIKDKVYPVQVKDESFVDELISFIVNEAEWKAMEALGIFEVSQQLNEVKKEGIKNNSIFLKSLAIQALNFFINKKTGKGLKEANRFLSFIRPINDTMKMIKTDTDELNALEMKLAAAENGIKIDKDVEKDQTETQDQTKTQKA